MGLLKGYKMRKKELCIIRYGHDLNLACADAIKRCKITKDGLDSAYELIKLIKFSPKREAIFNAYYFNDCVFTVHCVVLA